MFLQLLLIEANFTEHLVWDELVKISSVAKVSAKIYSNRVYDHLAEHEFRLIKSLSIPSHFIVLWPVLYLKILSI